jgi:hypothetical protein
MKRHFLTYEEANTESLRLGTLIREKNQAYLDKLGKWQTDNTLKWDEPQDEENGYFSIQDHPQIQGYVTPPDENPIAMAGRLCDRINLTIEEAKALIQVAPTQKIKLDLVGTLQNRLERLVSKISD